jgi:hypothetical protein
MSDKPRKPGLEESEVPYKPESDYVPGDAFDAYLWRNRHAINASCDKADEEYRQGKYYTLDEVMAELGAQAKRRRARKADKA